jgi:protein-S-isoprenylcysteine O-methyltransferase Ste14
MQRKLEKRGVIGMLAFIITPSVFLLLLITSAIFCFHQMVKNEEKYSEKVHGSEYRDYRKRVGKYLPKIKEV